MVDKQKIEWLLDGSPWVKYNSQLHLLGKSESDPQMESLRKSIVVHSKIKPFIDDLLNWPGQPLKRHNDSSHLIHKLTFLADLSLTYDDGPLEQVIEKILEYRSAEGPFYIMSNVHPRYGGSGKDEFVWFLCDAPLILYALAKFGLTHRREVVDALQVLLGFVRENGWPCKVSKELGKFRGPGRKEDACPYATLLMVKLISQFPDFKNHRALKIGIESLLDLWDKRKTRRPYLFAMGTDFQKLKAPLVWFDVLHVLDTLSNFADYSTDARVRKMLDSVNQKGTPDGRFIPESVFRPWKDWDFGQKKDASEWLSFLVYRIQMRFEQEEKAV